MGKWGKRKKAPISNSNQAKKVKAIAPEVWSTTKVFDNAAFYAYYDAQALVDPSELQEFKRHLVEPLPLAMRINGNMPTARFLLKQISSLCSNESEPLHPRELSWCSGGLSWQWNGIDRRVVKKKAEFKELKQWFTAREKHGAISRQETVSMIPALYLDVQSHHTVLDFCAAPGSKTCQIIELLHRRDVNSDWSPLRWVEGAVFANDVETKRANMLAHQVQRLGSPSVAVVNVDAAFFPKLMRNSEQLLFDRVLCDVPCTGDGTLRKQPHIWKTWDVKGGLGLHVRQLGILQRGLELLKVDGRLVYSTCSFNPIENEAVISAILKKFENVKLIDVATEVGVKSHPALKTWRVPKPDGLGVEFYNSYDEVPKQWQKIIAPTMFHGESTDHILGRRFLPHLMNTGGFFCAVFTKTESVTLKKRLKTDVQQNAQTLKTDVSSPKITDSPPPATASATSSKKWVAQGSDYAVLKEDSEAWREIQAFYGLDAWARESIFVSKLGNEKKLYAINKGVQQLLNTEGRTQLKFVTAGIRVLEYLEKVGGACKYRLSQEGLDCMFAFGMSRRVVKAASLEFVRRLLNAREVPSDEAKEHCSDWEQICQEGKIVSGSAVVMVSHGAFEGLALNVMVSQKTMTLYVGKQESAALAESVAQSDNLKGIIDAAAAVVEKAVELGTTGEDIAMKAETESQSAKGGE